MLSFYLNRLRRLAATSSAVPPECCAGRRFVRGDRTASQRCTTQPSEVRCLPLTCRRDHTTNMKVVIGQQR
eukprot:6193091-Pleurochrysis_carterae.AAC.3